MSHSKSMVAKLDEILTVLESSIMTASSEEILKASVGSNGDDVSSIVRSRLATREKSPVAVRSSNSGTRKVKASRLASDSMNKLTFLRQLVASRPELSNQIRAVFSAGESPTSDQLDQITEELVKLGVLPKKTN